jgi:lauroyl/myristoyl acyltransferase
MMAYALSQQHTTFKPEQLLCKLEQLLYILIIVPLIAFLPAPVAYRIACWRGDWAYCHDTLAREQIMSSLKGVLGGLGAAECSQLTHGFFRRRSCEAIDMMRLAGRGSALKRLVEIRGQEHLEAALATGKGAILCSAHSGFFNGGFSLLGAYGFPITVVGDQKSRSDPGMPLFMRLFWRFGIESRVARHRRRPNIQPAQGPVEAALQIADILRSNEVIALAIDVPTPCEDRGRAVSVNFLGHQIPLLPGGVSIAEVTGTQVLTLVMHRSADWRHQILEISPVQMEDGIESVFKRCVALIEAPIRHNLAHWNGWENPKSLVELELLSAVEK